MLNLAVQKNDYIISLEERLDLYRRGYRVLLAYLIFDIVFKFFV